MTRRGWLLSFGCVYSSRRGMKFISSPPHSSTPVDSTSFVTLYAGCYFTVRVLMTVIYAAALALCPGYFPLLSTHTHNNSHVHLLAIYCYIYFTKSTVDTELNVQN